ncbi:MAG: hypothetical protein IJJ26_13570 [Victivallales bacterium]|nr:hypothetical protein [Victivallales bacterium]
MQSKLFLALLVSSISAFAAGSVARFDVVNGQNDTAKVRLSPVATETVKASYPNWVADEEERVLRVTYQDPDQLSSTEWKTFVFSFKAEGSGTVYFQIGSGYAKEVEKRGWAYARNIKVNGDSWKQNGDLKKSYINKKTKLETPAGFNFIRKPIYVKNAGDEKPAMQVNFDNRISFGIPVEEGKTYEISVDMMAAPTP